MSDKRHSDGLADYLLVISKWKRFIILNVFIVTLVAIVVSFFLSETYTASGSIMPTQKSDPLGMLGMSAAGLSQQLGPLRMLSGLTAPAELYGYLAIIESRTLAENVVERFNLMEVYEIDSGFMSDAIKQLRDRVKTDVKEEGTLTIQVKDGDPVRAMEMVNYIFEQLDRMNRDLSTREARDNRSFIERRLDQNVVDLRIVEDKLQEFQEVHNFIAIPDQAESSIMAVAQLYAIREIAAIEVASMRRYLSESNPIFLRAQAQLDELQKRMSEFPELGVEYLRLYRDFTVQQTLYERLVPILEQARLEEQRDTPTLLVLDYATVPEQRSWPKRSIIAIVFFLMSFIVSLLVVFAAERMNRLNEQDPEQYQKFRDAFKNLFTWRRK
jgi:tyrosine-protein kinase Etk/Wzc